jgi:hypothetical protein
MLNRMTSRAIKTFWKTCTVFGKGEGTELALQRGQCGLLNKVTTMALYLGRGQQLRKRRVGRDLGLLDQSQSLTRTQTGFLPLRDHQLVLDLQRLAVGLVKEIKEQPT